MRTDKLLKLADFLETVPPKVFDLSQWQTQAPTKPEGKKPGDCGFAGCAVGWAAHAKLFRGFGMEIGYPLYYGRTGFRALDMLFGFPADIFDWASEEAKYLFTTERYPPGTRVTPKQVARRIRAFVKTSSTKRTK